MRKLKVLFTNSAPLISVGISSGFKNLGHEVYIMDGFQTLWNKPKHEQIEIFQRVIEKESPDLVFSECFADFSEDIFIYTRKVGIPHFFWSVEDTPHTHWIGDYWSDYADHIFTTSAECLPNYWNKGKSADLMLFGCNPSVDKKLPFNKQFVSDISLVANNYDSRSYQVTDYLFPLINSSKNVSVYGNSWWNDGTRKVDLSDFPNVYKGYVSYSESTEIYSSSKIALGFNCDKDSITQTSMRMFQVLAVGGGILISPFTPAQQYLFHDHVYLPKNTDEMLLMVDEVLSMTDIQREQMAKKAQDFVYKYHNYNLRAEQVINAYHGYKP
ncbi:glycosyltransferase [Paenibacillus sp. CFBP 13594]|uniref:CgeB family protein n=1 Tax=Paenibacillus sp. CFBP 13594 TaxID=2774037 RepID=UPI00178238DE|nr:glycosyltransferase [Paenibacillus sp. CFBP 13594]MBD8839492.1 glycosyltransferase [Paenibacillus sp. CFBP 13594]